MNLSETERLVRRIADVLENRAPAAQAGPLAKDYAEVCQTAQHRLAQCALMLARGEEQQALQLAEETPSLLDLLTRLGFRQANEWRDYCLANDLPQAEPFDPKLIRELSAAYGKGLMEDHQLYRDYREAVLRRDDLRAVAALRSIVRRNPADANAPRELKRLERNILAARLAEIQQALEAGAEDRVAGLVKAVEGLDFQHTPSGDGWRNAQKVCCRLLLREAQALRPTERWSHAALLLARLLALSEQYQLTEAELGVDHGRVLRELESWVETCQRAELDEKNYQRALVELRRLVASSEEKQMSGLALGRVELREAIQAFDHARRALEAFERPVPEDLARRSGKAAQILRSQLAGRTRRLRNLAYAGLALFLLSALVGSGLLLRGRKAHDLAGELDHLRTERRPAGLEKLLAQVRNQHGSLAARPALRKALERADLSLRQEQQQRQSCEALLSQLEGCAAAGFTNLSVERIQRLFESSGPQVAALALDYQPPLQNHLLTWQNAWETWLDQQRQAREAALQKGLRPLELSAATGLSYERDARTVRAALTQLEAGLKPLQELTNAPVAPLRLAPDLLAQLGALQQRMKSFASEVEQWEHVQAVWKAPPTLEAYVESLRLFQKSEFAAPAQSRAAGEVLALNPTSDTLFFNLLLPGQAEAWGQFLRQSASDFRPPDVMPAERSRFLSLRDDENIQNLHLCRVSRRALPSDPRAWVRVVYSRGPLVRLRTGGKAGMVYDPGESPGTLDFKQHDYDNFEFTLEELGRCKEAAIFDRVGLKEFLDSRTGTNYVGRLLRVLDQINQERDAPPIFRAYLVWRLHELMEMRAVDWGLQWAPQATADRERLRGLGAANLRSGDWLIPNRSNVISASLEAHFTQARQVSYLSQAMFLNKLAGRVRETGLSLAGYVNAEGQPQIRPDLTGPADLWGWAAENKAPMLLLRTGASPQEVRTVNRPLPCTPLLVLRTDRAQLAREVAQSFSSPLREGEDNPKLLPLFAAP